jgi:hypothetical protein
MRLERLRQQILLKLQDIDKCIEAAEDHGNLQLIESLTSERDLLLSDEEGQRNYARMILQIGNGNVTDSENISLNKSDPSNYSTTYNFKTHNCFVLQDKQDNESNKQFEERSTLSMHDTVQHFYPNGFESHKMHNKTILAATNKQVDKWNNIVQKMNPNYSGTVIETSTKMCKTYYSADKLAEVDDPKNIISEMLSEEILNSYNSDKSPPHALTFCVGDICYLMRTLGKKKSK